MESEIKNNIAGVVILYYPDYDVLGNISSYLNQISYLIVVDNTDGKTEQFLLDFCKNNSNIEYVYNNSNLGIASALNIGAKKAIEKGYKYLLTMDQDSKAAPDMVANMMKMAATDKNIGIISPFYVNKFETKEIPDASYNYEFVVMTSGNILNLSVYKLLGPFKDEYFIDYVDTEYCLRLAKNNFKILRINNAFLYHNEANINKVKFFNKIVYPHNHSPIRLYFKTRNRLYLRDEYKKYFPSYFKYEYILFRNIFIKIIFYETEKLKKLCYVIKGYLDYLRKIKFSPFNN